MAGYINVPGNPALPPRPSGPRLPHPGAQRSIEYRYAVDESLPLRGRGAHETSNALNRGAEGLTVHEVSPALDPSPAFPAEVTPSRDLRPPVPPVSVRFHRRPG